MTFEPAPPPCDPAAADLLLDDALRRAARDRWQGRRAINHGNAEQAEFAIADLKARYGKALRVSDVSPAMLKAMVREWQRPKAGGKKGLAGAVIAQRLNALSGLGVTLTGMRPRPARKPRPPASASPVSAPPPPCGNDERDSPPTVTETGIVFQHCRFTFPPMTVWSDIPPHILRSAGDAGADGYKAYGRLR